jgi:hypothetical protein
VVTKTPEQRFWSKVDKQEDCWIWIGGSGNYGYGQLHVGDRGISAHRFSWEIHNGKIPDGLEVCHSCDVPACVNPEHLWLGTHAENMRDMEDKGRTSIPGFRGVMIASSKLTEEQVRSIRKDTRKSSAIAKEFNITRENVWMIKKRKSWKWLED